MKQPLSIDKILKEMPQAEGESRNHYILRLIDAGVSQSVIATHYGVSRARIWEIKEDQLRMRKRRGAIG